VNLGHISASVLTSAIVVLTMVVTDVTFARQSTSVDEQELGVGMVRPTIGPGATLYFYGAPNLDQSDPAGQAENPVDSVTFVEAEYYVDIATAPPWLVPEVLKLDYQLFYFRARSISRYWVEVVGNRTSGQTVWVLRSDVEFIPWVDFFLDVYAVEPLDVGSNPLRPRPFDYSDPLVVDADEYYEPIEIRGTWMRVRPHETSDVGTGTGGWIKWRDAERLLISFSLLS
jgi:hypothetical protein